MAIGWLPHKNRSKKSLSNDLKLEKTWNSFIWTFWQKIVRWGLRQVFKMHLPMQIWQNEKPKQGGKPVIFSLAKQVK